MYNSFCWWFWWWTSCWWTTWWRSLLSWYTSTSWSWFIYLIPNEEKKVILNLNKNFLPKPSCTEAMGTACRDDVLDCWEVELRVEVDRTLDGVLAILDKSSKCDYKRSWLIFRSIFNLILLVLSTYYNNVLHRDQSKQFDQ